MIVALWSSAKWKNWLCLFGWKLCTGGFLVEISYIKSYILSEFLLHIDFKCQKIEIGDGVNCRTVLSLFLFFLVSLFSILILIIMSYLNRQLTEPLPTGKEADLHTSFQVYCLQISAIPLQVYGWGRGEHGRLGFGDNDKSSKMLPQRVHLLAGEHIVQVLA